MIRALFAGLTATIAFSGMSVAPAFSQEESDQRLGTAVFWSCIVLHSRRHATRPRNGGSTAACATSTRSGTGSRAAFSKT
jgi:hypothetical protein